MYEHLHGADGSAGPPGISLPGGGGGVGSEGPQAAAVTEAHAAETGVPVQAPAAAPPPVPKNGAYAVEADLTTEADRKKAAAATAADGQARAAGKREVHAAKKLVVDAEKVRTTFLAVSTQSDGLISQIEKAAIGSAWDWANSQANVGVLKVAMKELSEGITEKGREMLHADFQKVKLAIGHTAFTVELESLLKLVPKIEKVRAAHGVLVERHWAPPTKAAATSSQPSKKRKTTAAKPPQEIS